MNTKSITIAALITLSSLSMSNVAMADEITENTAALSQTSNNDFSATVLVDSVQNTVEQQVDAQLERFVSAVGSSIATNLDTILSSIVNK